MVGVSSAGGMVEKMEALRDATTRRDEAEERYKKALATGTKSQINKTLHDLGVACDYAGKKLEAIGQG